MFYFTATVSETSTLSIFYIRSVVMMSASGFSDVFQLVFHDYSHVSIHGNAQHTHTHTYRTYTQPLPHPTTHYRPSLVNITDHLTVLTCSVNTVSVDEAHMKVCLLHSPNTSLLQDCKSKTGSSAPTHPDLLSDLCLSWIQVILMAISCLQSHVSVDDALRTWQHCQHISLQGSEPAPVVHYIPESTGRPPVCVYCLIISRQTYYITRRCLQAALPTVHMCQWIYTFIGFWILFPS